MLGEVSSLFDVELVPHLQPLPNGMFRIGVHIADVAHFVAP
jgi:exoribonuclease R